MLYFSIGGAATAALIVLISGMCGLFVQSNRTLSHAITLSVLLLCCVIYK